MVPKTKGSHVSGSTSDNQIHLDSAKLKDTLSRALSAIQGQSAFATGIPKATFPNPGLDIHNHGTVGLPLSQRDAQSIKTLCRKSAFGKGTKTCVDDKVRRSWELNPDQFTLRNPEWDRSIKALLPQIREKLNIVHDARDMEAQLYKLLLYEEGAFFKAHQDSEKAPGMFGTLVVALPSPHQGGDLAFRHHKESFGFSTATHSNFEFSWAAWYSDVFHEVKTVTSSSDLYSPTTL